MWAILKFDKKNLYNLKKDFSSKLGSGVKFYIPKIKIQKFNAEINNLTINTESKDKNGTYNNIYINKKTDQNNFQIIYAD